MKKKEYKAIAELVKRMPKEEMTAYALRAMADHLIKQVCEKHGHQTVTLWTTKACLRCGRMWKVKKS